MNLSRSLPLCVASVFLCTIASQAQHIGPAVRPIAQVVSPIDESQRVTLTHTVSPLANAANDRGAAPDGMQLDRMQLVLQRSPAQESALRQLIAEMNTPGTASYHQWLSPDQFGAQFGASDQDIATISSWLGGHGFAVSRVNPGKGTLEFSGSVAQLRNAFHTQIHKYSINGETHFANANDPQIPAALAPAISGFASLNNFHPKSYLEKLGKASMSPATHQLSQWTWSNGSSNEYILAPGDFAVQYDVQPLYNSNVNGTGQTIAIINDSNINIDLVNQFRSLFNLPLNPPQVIIDGNDPGVDGINNPDGPNGDSIEAYLDVEWSGAVAPNATIDLVVAGDTSLESGLILAMEHAVYGNVAPVMSLSFGQCESTLGSTNAFLSGLWEQAAAQGQTVMVSSGDSGSAGCDSDDTQQFAIDGQAVSGFASTPYNVAVGGTDFYYSDYATGGASISNYWSTTTSQLPAVSIKGVIPEQPWNDGPYGLDIFNQFTADGSTSIAGGSGGASTAAICAAGYSVTTGVCSGSLTGYPKPAWQSGAGVPSDNVRDIPDVSLFAANGDNNSFYPICATDGDCQTAGLGGNPVQIYGVGGTSASSPAFAGIMALVVEKWGRQGQADNILYALKTQYPAAFHDVTHGSNSVPCELSPASTPNCISATPSDSPFGSGVTEGQIGNTTSKVPEYNATAGYNPATGLGTIDANNLVTDWPNVHLAATATTMNASQTTFAHGTPITITGAVTGTATPTGNVALVTDSTEPVNQGQAVFPLASGAYSGAVTTLPGGTYHIWGQYGGDSNNAMSTSTPPIQITVSPETPGMDLNLFNVALQEYFTSTTNPGTQVDYGSQLMVSALVAPASQVTNLQNCDILGTNCSSLANFTTPTGTVTFTDNGNPINTAVVNAEDDAEYNAPFAVGAHSVSATYNGDQSYNKVTASSPIAFTVIKDQPAFFFGLSNENANGQIIAGQPTVFNIIVENGAQYTTANSTGSLAPVPVAPPTGTVTISSPQGGFTGTATLSAGIDPSDGAHAGIGVITLNSLSPGNYTLTLNYSGDGNYQGGAVSTATGGIQVVAGSGLTASVTNASIVGSISPNSTITITGTVTGSGTTAPTGGVIFFSSGFDLGEITLIPTAGDVSTFSAVVSSQDLLPGSNFITLQYTGDTHYAPSEFNLSSGGPLANPQSDFTLIPSTTIVPVSISAGASSGTDTINLASVNGFNGNVTLTCTPTAPVTCSVASPIALSNQSSTTASLTINVPAGTASKNYNVLVTGKDATSEFVHTLAITADVTGGSPAITLTNSGSITVVQGATTGNTSVITVAPSGGFTGNVNLTCSVVSPIGASNPVTCAVSNFSPNPVDITGTSSVTSTLTVNTSGTTTEGTYVISVVGTSGSVTSATDVTVTVNLPQDFSLIPSGAITVNAGATTGNTATIAVTPSNGFTGNVALTCAVTTAPNGATKPTCTIGTPADITTPSAVNETLTVTSSGSTTTGAYVITVTGTAGSDVHTTTVNVTVNAAAASTYTVTATTPAAISPGSSANSTITVTGSGGYTGAVTLNCSLNSGGPTNQSGDAPTCTITSGSPVNLTVGAPNGSAIATVNTTAAVADLVRPNFGFGPGTGPGKVSPWSNSRFAAGAGATLAVLIFFGIPARRRSWRKLLGIVIAMAALGVLSSCGGGSSGGGGGGGTNPTNPGTTAGTYTFTITSTGNPAVTPAPTNPTFTVSVN
jgi:trimeric autotransporter adhesin